MLVAPSCSLLGRIVTCRSRSRVDEVSGIDLLSLLCFFCFDSLSYGLVDVFAKVEKGGLCLYSG